MINIVIFSNNFKIADLWCLQIAFNNYNIGVFYDLISVIVKFPNSLGIDKVYKLNNWKNHIYLEWIYLLISQDFN